MKNFICAFSSDRRELYKADIYKAISMPCDFVIHFRYKLRYVDDNILNNLKKLKDNDVVIFFTQNNTENKINNINNISIRKAKLIKTEKCIETGLFHAYMKLGEFCNVSIDSINNLNILPPNKFFSYITCTEINDNNNWHDIITRLKDSYQSHCFFQLKKIKTVCGRTIKITQSKDKKGCYYKLNHGTKYLAELSIANPNENKGKLKFEVSSEDITANIPNPIEISANFDDITFPIYIKSLNVLSESSFISFIPIINDNINSEYISNIEIEKNISLRKTIFFGIYSLLAISSAWIIKDNSESISNIGQWDWDINWKATISCISLLISSSMLFAEFNKK